MLTKFFALLIGVAISSIAGILTAAEPDDSKVAVTETPPSRALGIRVVDGSSGLLVTEVARESVAGRGGLQIGDLIMKLDGRPLRSHAELVESIRGGNRQSGLLIIVRDDTSVRIPLNWTIGASRRAGETRGPSDATKYNGVGNGLRIIRVDDGSWAHASGLMPSDRIVRLNTTPVTTKAHLIALLQDSVTSPGVGEIVVDRGGRPTTIELKLQSTTARKSLGDVKNFIGTNGTFDGTGGGYGGAGGMGTGTGGATGS